MPRLGLVLVATLGGGAQRAASFTMMSTALRRAGSSGVLGTRRGVMAYLGGVSASSPSLPRARWASTMMSATAQSAAVGGPSLSVHKKQESPTHPAYDVVEEDFVAEYGATTTLYKHKKSGAEVLSVQIDDDNKVRVQFRCHDPLFFPHSFCVCVFVCLLEGISSYIWSFCFFFVLAKSDTQEFRAIHHDNVMPIPF